jgi:hypothetical protein
MLLIGVDYHPSFQTIAFFDEETGECGEQELNHSYGLVKGAPDLMQRLPGPPTIPDVTLLDRRKPEPSLASYNTTF